MADPVADIKTAAASVGTTVEGAATNWVNHLNSLWLKRTGWVIACGVCLAIGFFARGWL